MKYLVIINGQFPLNYQDKIVYFDSEEEVIKFIDGCYLIHIKNNMVFKHIELSEINDEKFINYKDVHIM